MNVKAQLEGLRGGAYYDRWTDIWKGDLTHIKQEVLNQKATGKFTPGHLLRICDSHDLPWKPFMYQLEKEQIIPTGIYDKLPPLKKLREAEYAKDQK